MQVVTPNRDDESPRNCILGIDSAETTLPHSEVDRAANYDWKNVAPDSETRLFGVPTLRPDIAKPEVDR